MIWLRAALAWGLVTAGTRDATADIFCVGNGARPSLLLRHVIETADRETVALVRRRLQPTRAGCTTCHIAPGPESLLVPNVPPLWPFTAYGQALTILRPGLPPTPAADEAGTEDAFARVDRLPVDPRDPAGPTYGDRIRAGLTPQPLFPADEDEPRAGSDRPPREPATLSFKDALKLALLRDGPILQASEVAEIDARTADALARFEGDFLILGLRSLPPDVAESLATSQAGTVWLHSLTEIGPDAAAELAGVRGDLLLTGLDRLESTELAAKLAARPGPLSLPFLRSVSAAAAAALVDRDDRVCLAALAAENGASHQIWRTWRGPSMARMWWLTKDGVRRTHRVTCRGKYGRGAKFEGRQVIALHRPSRLPEPVFRTPRQPMLPLSFRPGRLAARARFVALAAITSAAVMAGSAAAATPSFAEFDARAKAGDRLTVVFFGASLTWGANATDQNYFSYRARVAARLTEHYPQARFTFHDAAIGGTGSQLGVFRLDRDVLARKPDLVFVDFTANDDINSGDTETLASYESIIRRLVTEARVPVVQVLFPFKWNAGRNLLAGMKRRDAHTAISAAYHTGLGDAVLRVIDEVERGRTTLDAVWDTDGVHPGNAGYDLFAAAAWDGYLAAVAAGKTCAAPDRMLHAPTYMKQARVRLSSLGELPAGWRRGKPNLTSAYFDMLMSRWLDDEVIATNRREEQDAAGKQTLVPQQVAPLEVRFRGEMVLLFGEGTPKSGRYRAFVDGKLVERPVPNAQEPLREFDPASIAAPSRGNAHHVAVIATGLDPATDHTLRIEPVFDAEKEQELRLESICVAGGDARVLSAEPR